MIITKPIISTILFSCFLIPLGTLILEYFGLLAGLRPDFVSLNDWIDSVNAARLISVLNIGVFSMIWFVLSIFGINEFEVRFKKPSDHQHTDIDTIVKDKELVPRSFLTDNDEYAQNWLGDGVGFIESHRLKELEKSR